MAPMYIIKTTSKSKKNSSLKYYTYRLVESIRVGDKVKRITLLNLGSDFSVDQSDWSTLSKRVDEIINHRSTLFEIDKELERVAQQYAIQIISTQAKKDEDIKIEDNYKEIDISSVKNSDIKDIGIENVIYKTIQELKLEDKLKELGFTNIQLQSAIGTIVAKIANPSSEAKAYNWLCNTSGINELLGCDYNKSPRSNLINNDTNSNTF